MAHLKGWDITVLKGTSATAASFADKVTTADFLHYAGHAQRQGTEGFQSSLLLAGRDTFEVGEILALPKVPSTIVLLGCETSMTHRNNQGWEVGLAEAFLMASSLNI